MKITENNPELFKKLDDCFPTPVDARQFIFDRLFNATEYENLGNAVVFDFWGNYGSRSISILFTKLNKQFGLKYNSLQNYYTPSESIYDTLSTIIKTRFSDKWLRIYKELQKDYESLKPLQLKTDNQLLEDKLKSTNKVIATRKTTGTDSNENETLYDKNDNKVFGFNSTVGVNSDSSDNTSKDTSVTTTDLTNTTNDSTDYSRDLSSHRIVERAGNIGNRLPSEMLEKEIEFRKYQIVDTIVNDILSVLTRSKYI